MHQSKERLSELESVIEANQPDFYGVGKALKEIQDNCLYRYKFDSFEAYVKTQWDMRRCHAYRLIAATQVIDNVSPIGDTLPKNEAQARPLTFFDATEQKKIWQAFLNAKLALNAATIRRFIETYYTPKKPTSNRDNTVELISADYESAVSTLLEQITIAQNEQWNQTSRAAAMHWNNVMRDKIADYK